MDMKELFIVIFIQVNYILYSLKSQDFFFSFFYVFPARPHQFPNLLRWPLSVF